MTSPRAYSRSKDFATALAELWRCSGTQFDPRVVAAFEAELVSRHGAELRRIAASQSSSGTADS
jgi:HD-GYP domain-containing protein (c-di-GMP phosphodiesterase class II)